MLTRLAQIRLDENQRKGQLDSSPQHSWMIPCSFRCTAPHISPAPHPNTSFFSHVLQPLSPTAQPLHPPHPSNQQIFSQRHLINFPPRVPNFSDLTFAFQPVQIFCRACQQPSPAQNRTFFLSKIEQILPPSSPTLQEPQPRKHCSTTFSINTCPLAPPSSNHLPPEKRQGPPNGIGVS